MGILDTLKHSIVVTAWKNQLILKLIAVAAQFIALTIVHAITTTFYYSNCFL